MDDVDHLTVIKGYDGLLSGYYGDEVEWMIKQIEKLRVELGDLRAERGVSDG